MAYQGAKNTAYGVFGVESDGFANPIYLRPGTISATTLGYLANVTSDIQTQFNNITTGYVNFKCVATATANITISTPGSTNWDGITPNNGDTVFLLPVASGGFQTIASQGGLYTYNGASSSLTRLSSMSTWAEIVGSRIYVDMGGTTFGATAWINTNNAGGTIDVTSVTYQQQQNSYLAGINLTLTGNVFATILIPSFTSETLTANTNFLVTGTTNTMTWTMATQTGSHTFTLPNANSNPIQPLTSTAGSVVGYIDSTGTQNLIVVINQVLTGFTATTGTITSADSILTAIEKNAGNLAALTPAVVHKTANYQFLVANTTVIMDANAQTGTLPSATAVLPGITYTLKLGTGATTGTLAVPAGQSLDNTLNGTFTISGAFNAQGAQSDGTGWYLV